MLERLKDVEQRLAKAVPPTQAISPGPSSPARALFRLGLIGLEELRSHLAEQGYGEPELSRLLKAALLERRRVVQGALLDAALRAFERGEIGDQLLREQLQRIGLPTEHLDDQVRLARARARPLPPRPSTIGLTMRAAPGTAVPQRGTRPSTIGLTMRAL